MNTLTSKSVILTLSLLVASFAFAGNSGKYTANYYKANDEEFIGKKIKLEITHLTPMRDTKIEGLELFMAHTVDSDEHVRGGTMIVATTSDNAEKLIRKYGTQAELESSKGKGKRVRETDKISGTLQSIERKREMLYLDADGKAKELIDAHAEKAKALFGDNGHKKSKDRY